MGDVVVDFEKQFHNLEGNLISERKKNFFKLLQNKSLFSNEEQLNTALKNLKPKTYLESLLQVDMLIYFKKTEELLRILKEGNEIFISKIIKQPWFFKEAFKNINAEEFVNEFLPCTSFVTRMKVLKRLSFTLSEAQMDEVFECVLKRYGLQVALNILHSCSSKKIIEILSSNEIYLRSNQVKMLFDKDRNLFKLYLEHYKDIAGQPYNPDYKIFRYFALKDYDLLLELNKQEKLCMHSVGRRSSKKIADHVKRDITQNIKLYAPLLRHDVIVRKLRDSFKDVYLDLFPRKMGDIDINSLGNKLLRYYPKSKQWSLFTLSFSQVFDNQSIADNLNHLDSHLIELCPQKDIKQRWAEIKYNSENDDSFLKYFAPSKAIPLLKEKINVMSNIYERLDLIKLMLDTCAQNKDPNSLEKVLEYFCFRHRNEEVSVRRAFLAHIQQDVQRHIKFEDLSENHWKYINEQIEILRINQQYNHYSCSIFIRKYLEYLFKNGKPFREEILQYTKQIISEIDSFLPDIKNPAVEKQIFIEVVNIIPEVPEVQNEQKYNEVCRQLILDVIKFNEINIKSDHCMSLLDFPILVTFINSIMDKVVDYNESQIIKRVIHYNYKFPEKAVNINNAKLVKIILMNVAEESFYFLDLIEYMVIRKNRSELDNQILQLYFDQVFDRHSSTLISSWFLKNEPLTIVPYFDKISKTLFFKEIKLYSHLNLDVRFITYLKNQLNNLNDPDMWLKYTVIKFLPVLLPVKDFNDIVVEHFLPIMDKLDLQDEEIKKMYNIQCEVVKVLKDVAEPGEMLPTAMKFCSGDYLQSALRSLYSICYRTPEKQLYPYMDVLSKKAVSARKHALFLSCTLLEHKYAVHQLKAAQQSNASSRKHIFSATLKYFLKNPSQDLFDMVISNMNMIDKNDTETLDSLTLVDCPRKYRAVYIEKCWEFFENMRKHEEVKVNRPLRQLLLAILNSSDILVALPSEFCKNIVDCYFKDNTDDLLNMELFVCNVLRYREMEQVENFQFFFEIIHQFKVDNKRECIKEFFEKFYVVVTEDFDSNFLNLFTEYWGRLFTPVEMFDEYILLKLLNVQCEAGEPFIENYAKGVVAFLEQLTAEYSEHVHTKFKRQLAKALESTFEKKKDEYLFFYNVLMFKTSIATSILVLDLMSKVEEDNLKEVSDIFYDIMKILKDVEYPIVKIYYKSYTS